MNQEFLKQFNRLKDKQVFELEEIGFKHGDVLTMPGGDKFVLTDDEISQIKKKADFFRFNNKFGQV